MPYNDNYFSELLKHMSDLESTKVKNSKAEANLHELEARVAELEENERQWQDERKILLKRIGDKENVGRKNPT